MNYLSSQFDYNPDTKVFSQEVSLLFTKMVHGILPNNTVGITITDHTTAIDANFVLVHTDKDQSGEDIFGWHYRPSMESVQNNPALAYTKVLIIND